MPKSELLELDIQGSQVYLETFSQGKKPSVGYLGPHLTNTEDAVTALLGDEWTSSFVGNMLKTNSDVVKDVRGRGSDFGVVPAENDLGGDVIDPLRELIKSDGISILAEVIRPIRHMLVGRQEEEIERVLSHPQALAQCDRYLNNNYPHITRVSANSTAEAVTKVLSTERNALAIATLAAGEWAAAQGLTILDRDIGDIQDNSTRFWLIGKGYTHPTGHDTTTAIFIPNVDYPGVLVECLRRFSDYGINLNNINSHPTGKMGVYRFFVSVDGHKEDEVVNLALVDLGKLCKQVRILGSYKKAMLPQGLKEPGSINEVS